MLKLISQFFISKLVITTADFGDSLVIYMFLSKIILTFFLLMPLCRTIIVKHLLYIQIYFKASFEELEKS